MDVPTGGMKKVISVGPSIRAASQEPRRPYGYDPIELNRRAQLLL